MAPLSWPRNNNNHLVGAAVPGPPEFPVRHGLLKSLHGGGAAARNNEPGRRGGPGVGAAVARCGRTAWPPELPVRTIY